MLRIKSLAIIGSLALATAACGDRPFDRALTGGAVIGAATAPRQYYY
jgi:osmotically inducible lipoprotein OsmB